ncbi:metal-dependent hydrolase, partial [Roseomonas sp. DSM 102946]|nr:metal-dependent hydrolase [Roseomonas sp. DSM 102946]
PLCRTGSAFEPLVVALILSCAGCGTFGKPDLASGWRAAGLCRVWQGYEGFRPCTPEREQRAHPVERAMAGRFANRS